jgi:hypothetical protein
VIMNFYRKHRSAWAFFATAMILMMPTVDSHSSQVVMGIPVASQDGTLAVSVMVTPGSQESVGALQFDLRYDESQYGMLEVAPGVAALGAGKDAVFSEPEPGVVRVVVAGMNSDAIAQGTVATLYFQSTGDKKAASGAGQDIAIDEVFVSDPYGQNTNAEVAYEKSNDAVPADESVETAKESADTANTGNETATVSTESIAPKNNSVVATAAPATGTSSTSVQPAVSSRENVTVAPAKAPTVTARTAGSSQVSGIGDTGQMPVFGANSPIPRNPGPETDGTTEQAEPLPDRVVSRNESGGLQASLPVGEAAEQGVESAPAARAPRVVGPIRRVSPSYRVGAGQPREGALQVASATGRTAGSASDPKVSDIASDTTRETFEVAGLKPEAGLTRSSSDTSVSSASPRAVETVSGRFWVFFAFGALCLLALLTLGAWKYRRLR